LIVAIFFGMLLLAIFFSGVGTEVLLKVLLYWVLTHGTLCALFTLLAGGHPLSALAGFAVSWFTALHPLLAAGWFSAIVEAKIRKPKVQDFRAIMDAQSFSEMRHIPLFRVVLVAALANVGSTLGTIVYFFVIPSALGTDPGAIITTGFQNLWSAILGLFF
jgi:pheromone shutdown protein TraB